MKPSVTILLPVFNSCRFLEECIESILNQSFQDYELLIIDDGSTDATSQVIGLFDDRRILYRRRDHLGLVNQLNYGLEISQCDVVARMDGDDIMAPERLKTQMEFMKGHPSVGAVGSSFISIDESGKHNGIQKYPLTDDDMKDALPVYNPISHPTVLYRRQLVLMAGAYREKYHPAEDLDLWMRLSEITQLANIDVPLLFKREQGHSISIQSREEIKRVHLEISRDYYKDKIETTLSKEDRFKLKLKIARCEYYYGSLTEARNLFFALLKEDPFNLSVLRYLAIAVFGERIRTSLSESSLYRSFKKRFNLRSRKYTL